MSNDLLEREPEHPEPTPETVLQRAYNDYLEALVLRDVSTLRWAGNIIRHSVATDIIDTGADNLYPRLTETFGSTLERKLMDNAPESEVRQITEVAFWVCLRAYTYSGVAIEPQTIRTAADMFGKDKKWLRGLLAPNHDNFLVIFGKYARKEPEMFASFQTVGRQALLRMGIAPLRQRLFSKLTVNH